MRDYLLEQTLSEASPSALQAHKLGLTYVGHGYWRDDTGQTVAKTVKGKLMKLTKQQQQKLSKPAKTQKASPDDLHPENSLITKTMGAEYRAAIRKALSKLESVGKELHYNPQQIRDMIHDCEIEIIGFIKAHVISDTDYAVNPKTLAQRILIQIRTHIRPTKTHFHINAALFDMAEQITKKVFPIYQQLRDLQKQFDAIQKEVHGIHSYQEHAILTEKLDAEHPSFELTNDNGYSLIQSVNDHATRIVNDPFVNSAVRKWQNDAPTQLRADVKQKVFSTISSFISKNNMHYRTKKPIYRGLSFTTLERDKAKLFLSNFTSGALISMPPCGFSLASDIACNFGPKNFSIGMFIRLHPHNGIVRGLHISGIDFSHEHEFIRSESTQAKVIQLNTKKYAGPTNTVPHRIFSTNPFAKEHNHVQEVTIIDLLETDQLKESVELTTKEIRIAKMLMKKYMSGSIHKFSKESEELLKKYMASSVHDVYKGSQHEQPRQK